jgi:hypothetical protein
VSYNEHNTKCTAYVAWPAGGACSPSPALVVDHAMLGDAPDASSLADAVAVAVAVAAGVDVDVAVAVAVAVVATAGMSWRCGGSAMTSSVAMSCAP